MGRWFLNHLLWISHFQFGTLTSSGDSVCFVFLIILHVLYFAGSFAH